MLTFLTCGIPALVIEGRRGARRSAAPGTWSAASDGWKVFGTIIVAGLLTGLVNSLLKAPFGDNWAARSFAASIASVVTMPYTAPVGVFIYLDLRVRKKQYSAADLERDLASSAT